MAQVIETEAPRGFILEKDPVRPVKQYWDFEGNLLAEVDNEHKRLCKEFELGIQIKTNSFLREARKPL